MNREDIVNLAVKIGLVYPDSIPYRGRYLESLERFAGVVAAKEREACAQICDSYAENSSSPMNFAENCAQSIRQRGKKWPT
jgi:hypothetical protein